VALRPQAHRSEVVGAAHARPSPATAPAAILGIGSRVAAAVLGSGHALFHHHGSPCDIPLSRPDHHRGSRRGLCRRIGHSLRRWIGHGLSVGNVGRRQRSLIARQLGSRPDGRGGRRGMRRWSCSLTCRYGGTGRQRYSGDEPGPPRFCRLSSRSLRVDACILHPFGIDDLRIDATDADNDGNKGDSNQQDFGTDRGPGASPIWRSPMRLLWRSVIRPQSNVRAHGYS
jgi:hypothetical protein